MSSQLCPQKPKQASCRRLGRPLALCHGSALTWLGEVAPGGGEEEAGFTHTALCICKDQQLTPQTGPSGRQCPGWASQEQCRVPTQACCSVGTAATTVTVLHPLSGARSPAPGGPRCCRVTVGQGWALEGNLPCWDPEVHPCRCPVKLKLWQRPGWRHHLPEVGSTGAAWAGGKDSWRKALPTPVYPRRARTSSLCWHLVCTPSRITSWTLHRGALGHL